MTHAADINSQTGQCSASLPESCRRMHSTTPDRCIGIDRRDSAEHPGSVEMNTIAADFLVALQPADLSDFNDLHQ